MSAQAKPFAIFTAGQPGCGKGCLASAAQSELSYDLIKIDVDEICDYHPNVEKLRQTHPYAWCELIHDNAIQWAKELRDAAIEGRKNIIIDTTLSNGDSAVKLLNDLRSKGYETEVRAIAVPIVESQPGIDIRFTNSVEANGFDRYVHQKLHDAAPDALPVNQGWIQTLINAFRGMFNQ